MSTLDIRLRAKREDAAGEATLFSNTTSPSLTVPTSPAAGETAVLPKLIPALRRSGYLQDDVDRLAATSGVDVSPSTTRPATGTSTPSLRELDLPADTTLRKTTKRGSFSGFMKKEADVSLIPLSPLSPKQHTLEELNRRIEGTEEVQQTPLGGGVHQVANGKGLLMLIKSFIGAGILFLPNAFRTGGLVFSSVMVVVMGYLSLKAMWLLVDVQVHLEKEVDQNPYFTSERRVRIGKGDFAGVGRFVITRRFGESWAKWAEVAVDTALALSQFGFCCTTFIFFASNCAPILASTTSWTPSIDQLIFLQLLFYIPTALLKQLAKISFLAIFADIFILFGLVGVLYFDVRTITAQGIAPKLSAFTSSWPLFLGTVVYAFEGIGLVLAIK